MFNSFPVPRPESGGGSIKSIQRGTATLSTTSTTVPITAVVPANSVVEISFLPNTTGIGHDATLTSAEITNATTLTFTKTNTSGVTVTISWVVYEYSAVKSKQTGIRTMAALSETITITGVDPLKARLVVSYKGTTANTDFGASIVKYELTNATTISISTLFTTKAVYWQLLEFY